MEQSYKEKYERALAKAKEQYNYPCMRSCMGILEEIFPELKESENEKVRKALISFLKSPFVNENITDEHVAPWLAWLEKQGQVKESTISQHEIETCKENDDSLTSDDEKVIDAIKHGLKCLGWEHVDGIKISDMNAWLEKQAEQKSTDLEEFINELSKQFPDVSFAKLSRIVVRVAKWVKSNDEEKKGRVHPKQEWSEEDEQHIDSLLKRLDSLCRNKFERTRFAISEDRDWLKSLRPQNKWKPSDEQIGLLQAIINEPNNASSESCQIVLKDILEQLKKLKEGEV